ELTTSIVDEARQDPVIRGLGVSIDEMSWSVVALSRSINIASIFPMIFGALGLASELSSRTITTTFLTAPNRAAVLNAKAITYVLWGVIFGVAIAIGSSLGVLIGSGESYLPDGKQWFLILLAGVIMCTLWCLLGLGVGALIGSPVGALVLLLVYALVIGPFGELVLFGLTEGSNLPGWLPNGSANGLTGSTASTLLFDQIQTLVLDRGGAIADATDREAFEDVTRVFAGAPGAFSLWFSGLIFAGWTALFFVTGIFRNKTRDIT
nr:ABC transporter permease [Actinomycetota bacterium]